ncbi:MAG: FAD-binding oxidoreductase [Pseudomonadota bacterium]
MRNAPAEIDRSSEDRPALAATPPFAPGFRATPYWLEGLGPPPALPGTLPRAADVVVIGSGYTGLNAALQTARGGRTTLVLEAGAPGEGCSTRNGGQISTGIKPSRAALTRRHGAERAAAIRAEGRSALGWIGDFLAEEGIDCGFRRNGRFHAAHTPAHYEDLARRAERTMREDGVEAFAVPAAEQRAELGTGFYTGGVVFPAFASLHPARYHRGLLRAALGSGVQVVAHCPALSLQRRAGGIEVTTPQGTVRARDVVVATNGYTGALTPWLRRRVIPIGSYVIATEPVAPDTMRALFPTGRIACDTRRVVYYYGPSPDGTRVVFGGRVSAGETEASVSGPRLHADLAAIFPELADTRISHAWQGTVAYTFDTLPHCGRHEGVHYAGGYCGSGVAMASYLGMKTGLAVLGRAEGRTAFDGLPFPSRPLYAGRPWFLPAAVALYRALDRFDRRRAGLA